MLRFKPVKFQIASDLHLDLNKISNYDKVLIKGSAQNLILAGDIAEAHSKALRPFLEQCSKNFSRVLYVAGNHEYYNSSIVATNNILKSFEQEFPNFRFLDNETIDISAELDDESAKIFSGLDANIAKKITFPSVKVIGSTLWSDIPSKRALLVNSHMNDYRAIMDGEGLLKISKTNSLHETACKFIKAELDVIKEQTAQIIPIVVSHHAPSLIGTSHPMYSNKPTNCAFATELRYLYSRVPYWIHGHTHYSNYTMHNCMTEYGINSVVCSNQYGYNSEQAKKHTKYDPEMIITIGIKEKIIDDALTEYDLSCL